MNSPFGTLLEACHNPVRMGILYDIDGVLLDIDGTLLDGERAITGTAKMI
jgi:hypothetical protein